MAQNMDLKTPLVDAGFTGDLITPSDPDYQASLRRFAKHTQRNAALVAFVKSAEDVARVIKFASTSSVPFVVRGGGHSTGGSSSIEGGIVIDLSKYLNTVRVDEENKLGYVGGGADWKAVDEEAIKYGLATVGGTVNHTGVGGLTLGGGFGYLMGEHGLVIDNLVQATLVTADGAIRTVNAETEPDLFWAIRGGGGNFGCATEFVYRLHPQRAMVYAGPLIFPPTRVEEVFAEVGEWSKGFGPKEALITIMTSRGPTGQPAVGVFVFFNGDEEEGKEKFKRFFDLGPIMTLAGMVPYEKLNSMHNEFVPYNINCNITSMMHNCVTPSMASTIFDQLLTLANTPSKFKAINPTTKEEEDNAITLVILWEYWNLNKLCTQSPDATAFRLRVPYLIAPSVAIWTSDDPEAAAEGRERHRALRTFCEGELKSTFGPEDRSANGTGYGNGEPSDTRGQGAKSLFGDNYPRLQSIKAKYDPNLLFNSWFPIQPASSA